MEAENCESHRTCTYFDPYALLHRSYRDHPLPVRKNSRRKRCYRRRRKLPQQEQSADKRYLLEETHRYRFDRFHRCDRYRRYHRDYLTSEQKNLRVKKKFFTLFYFIRKGNRTNENM